MKNKKLLTIGIPTYNGSKYIKNTLETIFEQDGYDADLVEVLISDNASTDNTKEIIQVLQNKYPNQISYYINDSNIGYDKNVDNLFKKAQGEFVEILGDDDYYSSNGSLSIIIQTIKNNKNISVLLLSSKFINIENQKEIVNTIVYNDTVCNNGNEFFIKSKWSTAAVSSIIIKTKLWNAKDLSEYFGTQWIHIGALVNILVGDANSFIFSKPLINIRTGNPRWENNFGNQYLTGLQHLAILKEMKKLKYQEEAYNFFINDRYQTNLKDIASIGPKDYRKRIIAIEKSFNSFKLYPLFWIIHVPMLLIPSQIFQFLKKIKRKFENK